ncbi:hypothetical protein ACWDQ0_35655 [Streptomyces sp. NPDC003642]
MPDRRRRTKGWGALKGRSKQDNAVAGLLRSWLDEAQLRIDDVVAQLTPEHFSEGNIPSRSTVGQRLAGVCLDDEFVQAIADICSGDDAALRERLLQEARALAASQDPLGPPLKAASELDPSLLAKELIAAQKQSLALQDKLLRAWEREAELKQARSNAHRMVMVLLTMVDKLQCNVTDLTAERDRLRVQTHQHHRLDTVRRRLARSEQQRRTAEASLQRARDERSKADRLIEEAAEQIRSLTAELERLRHRSGQSDIPSPPSLPHRPDADAENAEAEAKDIDDALVKASLHLDEGAQRLDELAHGLHQDLTLDISAEDTPSGEGAEQPATGAKDTDALTQEILQLLRNMRKKPSFVEVALTSTAEFIVGLLNVMLAVDDDEEAWDMAYEILHIAATQGTPTHICALTAELRSRQNGDTYAYELLRTIATERTTAGSVASIVAALREAQQPADAYQLLNAVGRERAAALIYPVLLSLSRTDAEWVLETVTAERTRTDITMLRAMLHDAGFEHYVALLPPRTNVFPAHPAHRWLPYDSEVPADSHRVEQLDGHDASHFSAI